MNQSSSISSNTNNNNNHHHNGLRSIGLGIDDQNQRILGRKKFNKKNSIDPDDAIRETDNDASSARLSAIAKGYIKDQFAEILIGPSEDQNNLIRQPWFNIGTHHRTYLIDLLIESFLKNRSNLKKNPTTTITTTTNNDGQVQVISLGSGNDSRYWRLKDRLSSSSSSRNGEEDRKSSWNVKSWIEIDFKENTSKKLKKIVNLPLLRNMCGGDQIKLDSEPRSDNQKGKEELPTDLYGPCYSLVSGDLRNPKSLVEKLRSKNLLDPNLPTIIIAELVFVYMLPEQTQDCLKAFVDEICGGGGDNSNSDSNDLNIENDLGGMDLMVITFEVLNLGDNFSKTMIKNLSSRGLTLLGFESNSSVESQIRRFESLKFDEIVSENMKEIRLKDGWDEGWRSELERIRRLEFLDEVEELELILEHYCLTWALKKIKGDDNFKSRRGLKMDEDHSKRKFHLPYR